MLKAIILIGGPLKGTSTLGYVCYSSNVNIEQKPSDSCTPCTGWNPSNMSSQNLVSPRFKHTGTRFRPLSLDIPKPLFPVAGLPMIQHHVEACAHVPNLKEILILGYYPANELQQFIAEMVQEYKVNIRWVWRTDLPNWTLALVVCVMLFVNFFIFLGWRYLQEFTALGTAGGMFHFRDQISSGNPDAFFVLNGDVCADLPLAELLASHLSKSALVRRLFVFL